MSGGAGNDILVGGAGNDVITTGTGLDTVVIEKDTGVDRVTDFAVAEDKIDLTPYYNALKASGVTPAADYVKFVANGTATEVRIDADGSAGSGAPVTVATLDNVAASAMKVGTNVIAPAGSSTSTPTSPTTGGTATNTITVTAHSNLAGGVGGHFKVLVDGKQVGEATANTTTATAYTFKASLTQDAAHKVQVQYDNDAVVNGVDRNLHIKGIAVDGKAMASTATGVTYDKYALDGQDVISGQTGMWWNGTLTFNPTKDYFHASAPVASAAPAEAGSVDLWNHVAMQQAPAVSAEAVAAQATTFDAAVLNALHADPLLDQHELASAA
ncbi:carbohydrate-binding domain-containing protein, partial [Azospirillum sp.]|uniref:carbohydrate-binding domain-containing protein n=1 Tax=Azospirillum sp. TaxID=34012 RepID=UPI002D45BEEF